ncbi:acetyl-CoA carboxylase biotin carboxyl carrier protein subunit [Variovorax ginsengisoli]|uniref:Acetyl-CoA carboxylase biotin carboxyl carrier protein n=1 Tax=Variovorax ginsengisoli TaxID=363844 RepID=A0ABT9S936_9BURK|nr:acetyl-CoA carboxylase biotin carboxyl carrier protein subunit [Variovorax ginsengisoli]MDP9900865.1 acetyl-CoA carboxylase biotin carboxyl carrier protein [Variovorax ginsengisoli]
MDASRIDLLAGWLAGTDIDLLELRSPTRLMRLQRGGAKAGGAPAAPAAVAEAAAPAVPAGTSVTAWTVGVFLDRHPLRAQPFVQAGEAVTEGRLLGLLQIGSLLLPVVAPCAGIAGTLQVASGSTVDYGTPLLAIAPSVSA